MRGVGEMEEHPPPPPPPPPPSPPPSSCFLLLLLKLQVYNSLDIKNAVTVCHAQIIAPSFSAHVRVAWEPLFIHPIATIGSISNQIYDNIKLTTSSRSIYLLILLVHIVTICIGDFQHHSSFSSTLTLWCFTIKENRL